MLKGDLTALLKQEYYELGYALEEMEDFLYLTQAGKVCAVFSTHGATIEKVESHIENGK